MLWKEVAGVASVVIVLLGLPLLLWYWQASIMPHSYSPGTKVITLTAVAKDGIWTEDPVVGHNYWRKKPTRVEDIPLNQGDHVVVRLKSADVLHSFAIPLLHVGPVDVPAGHTVDVEFDASRAGALTFLCWTVCSPQHESLRGNFQVKGNDKAGGNASW
jgi:heme/copper-type cytochrome/quinol oxidase subunit 2